MCLAVPGLILRVDEVGENRVGQVQFGGITRQAYLDFVPEAGLGLPAAGVALVCMYTACTPGPFRDRIPRPLPLVESTTKLQSINTVTGCKVLKNCVYLRLDIRDFPFYTDIHIHRL